MKQYGWPCVFFALPFIFANAALANDRLNQLRHDYDDEMMKLVISKYNAALADLDSKYATALEAAVVAASQSGKLDDALTLREERKRINRKGDYAGSRRSRHSGRA